MCQRGRDVRGSVSALAAYAARHVGSGRRLCGQERSKDALSPLAQQRRGFTVRTLPAHETSVEDNAALDALRGNTRTPPDEQAAFRRDYPAWLAQLGERNRRIAGDMALDERTRDLADRHGPGQAPHPPAAAGVRGRLAPLHAAKPPTPEPSAPAPEAEAAPPGHARGVPSRQFLGLSSGLCAESAEQARRGGVEGTEGQPSAVEAAPCVSGLGVDVACLAEPVLRPQDRPAPGPRPDEAKVRQIGLLDSAYIRRPICRVGAQY
jgi:hypothetical protein